MSSTLRPFALVQGTDSWSRAAHDNTFLALQDGVVGLAWEAPGEDEPPPGPPPEPAGLAFDAGCRLYRSVPAAGTVERTPWKAGSPYASPPPVELFVRDAPLQLGDFVPADPSPGPLAEPRGLAIDIDDRLFIAETARARILVFDLWSRRLLRAVPTPPGTQPLDLAIHERTVFATLRGSARLLMLEARSTPQLIDLPPEAIAPTRVAASPSGKLVVLVGAGTDDALIIPRNRPGDALSVPRATDLEWESDDTLVIARYPGETWVRYRMTPTAVESILPLVARGYDGMGIVRTPDGRIGFHTEAGFRPAVPARVQHEPRGSVTTYRLDSGEYQSVWGRAFVDACIPSGTSVKLSFVTSDEAFDEPTLSRTPPANLVTATIRRPDLSPPMPPLSLAAAASAPISVHRRESGRELAWVHPHDGDAFITYEAPVLAPPGRYLWVTMQLSGTSRVSPRVRSLRAETTTHDYLRKLPRTFSRDPVDADFLRRYLTLFHGLVDELENRAARREILLDPHGTPEDMLPWLASFLGLTLDERWPVHARRTLIAEAAWLFRFRGTIAGLRRFLEIYLERPVVILEQFRLRGMGGAIIGDRGPAASRAVLGGGFRVGGAVDDPDVSPLEGSTEDAFRTHAHRFSVLVYGTLEGERRDVVDHILAVHRPAHTIVEVCPLGAGMRVGRGLHVGISSGIGRTGGFRTLQLGDSTLGRNALLGRPEAGTFPEASRLGRDSRVG
ncbi:MAG: hypothetical protein GEU90_09100 [Gemmatimonas sp.]|nr:hypothetical protein [Gemmatimonas sp.]